ncbi:hydantoinase/oxoprolinase N-terminal domain-containing protein [Sphingomonas sp.]|uniref:hydantoinase/oxoprolinase N-terminal domain-containing protein n=1 Tax=Sphingomonas sp. TaxID=28214 RepID=UPI003869702C
MSNCRTICPVKVDRGGCSVRYIVGVDIGGTFTDCVAIKTSQNGESPVVKIGKSSSTPPDFQTGFIASLRTTAEMHGVALDEMLANARFITAARSARMPWWSTRQRASACWRPAAIPIRCSS